MGFEYYWTQEDLRAYATYVNPKAIKAKKSVLYLRILFGVFGVPLVYIGLSHNDEVSLTMGIVLILGAIFYKKLVLRNWNNATLNAYKQIPDRVLYGKRRVVLTDESIMFETEWQTITVAYPGVRDVVDAPKGIYVALQSGIQTIIPDSAFTSNDEKREVIIKIKGKCCSGNSTLQPRHNGV